MSFFFAFEIFFFLKRQDANTIIRVVLTLIQKKLPKYVGTEPLEIQVLTPMRKGLLGVERLNAILQQYLNPPDPQKTEKTHGGRVFRVGDKVMQTRNDYQIEWRKETARGWEDGAGVFNGDVGFITSVDTEEHSLTVLYDEEREVVYQSAQLENLDLAYCLSVHKSQGSEFPAVVMPVVGGPPMLLTRNLFYTALTRARSLVVLVGREEVIRQMVENDHILGRYTALSERLRMMARLLPQ